MAFLHKDGRGFFYLCQSRREGGRIVRKKLAYLGRLEMPDSENGRNEDHLRSGWWQWMYGKLKGDIRDILAGTKKPTWKFTHFYLEIVAKMYPNTRQEEKIISRAIVAYREWSRINDLDPLNPNVVPKK